MLPGRRLGPGFCYSGSTRRVSIGRGESAVALRISLSERREIGVGSFDPKIDPDISSNGSLNR